MICQWCMTLLDPSSCVDVSDYQEAKDEGEDAQEDRPSHDLACL